MFERFTDEARRTVVMAQEESRLLNHNYIGTEHLLLGLLRIEDAAADRALTAMGISLEAVRHRVEEIIGKGDASPAGHIPFTPRAKKVLELSLREAMQLGHSYIGTEHILLGLVREGEGVAAQVLIGLGASMERVRQHVIQVLSVGSVETVPVETFSEDAPRCSACRAGLAEHARYTTIDVAEHEGEGRRPVTFVFCGRCGAALAAS